MKKMKKIWMLALLAAGFAMVIGCSNGSSDSASGDDGSSGGNGGGQTSGTEKPSDPAGDDKVVTVFDPATYTGDAGKVLDGPDGAKYLEITVDGYKTTIGVNSVNLVGKTKFKCTMYGKEANADYNFVIKLADGDNADISTIPMYDGIVTTPTAKEAGVAEKTDWNEVSETMICTYIQPMVQDAKNGYSAQSGVVVYIGKIIAE